MEQTKKDIREYLHFYLGGKMFLSFNDDSEGIVDISPFYLNEKNLSTVRSMAPILRRLESMTPGEEIEFYATKVFITATPVHQVGSMHWTAETFRWLLNHRFDIFQLIDSGIAIEQKP